MVFVERENFNCVLSHGNSSVTDTTKVYRQLVTLWLHLICLSVLLTKYENLETDTNLSDHIPFILHINLDAEYYKLRKE